ncbi:hypothetical protein B0H12DRAFT_1235221 [Mycena haematopus]|nr:hypothetical protein B0H12DRAFT_1235221 [Mycena haematopus]
MSIDRDTQRLLPHPFTLKGVQRVLHGDTDAPPNPPPQDLSEDNVNVPRKGTVTRRYLLCDSKTNATLRLSIRVEPVPFPSSFLPPFVALPLPHNEILAGVGAAILLSTRAEVYRTCPHAFDLYPPPPPVAVNVATRQFDVSALPRACSPILIASIIDAIFNPAPVYDARLRSPNGHTYRQKTRALQHGQKDGAASFRASVSPTLRPWR